MSKHLKDTPMFLKALRAFWRSMRQKTLKGYWPLTTRIEEGLRFHVTRDRVQQHLYHLLALSPVGQVVSDLGIRPVLVCAVKDERLWINVYAADKIPGEHKSRLYNGNRGKNGTFTFVVTGGKVRTIPSPNPVRGWYYDKKDPVASLAIVLGDRDLDYLDDCLAVELPSLNRLDDTQLHYTW